MAGMRDMLLWMKLQQDKPEYSAFKVWQDRNQTKEAEPKLIPVAELETVEEAPSDKD